MANETGSSEVRAWLNDVSWTKNFARAEQDVASDPARIRNLLDFINSDQGSTKFTAEKILRNLSENRPALLYPYFDAILPWLDSPNAFIQWGGIFILGNLVTVDNEQKFPAIFDRFFALLNHPAMITAANVAAAAPAIIRHYPELEPEITRRLLAVPPTPTIARIRRPPSARTSCSDMCSIAWMDIMIRQKRRTRFSILRAS